MGAVPFVRVISLVMHTLLPTSATVAAAAATGWRQWREVRIWVWRGAVGRAAEACGLRRDRTDAVIFDLVVWSNGGGASAG